MTKRIYRIKAMCGGLFRVRAVSRQEARTIAKEVEAFGWKPHEEAPLS